MKNLQAVENHMGILSAAETLGIWKKLQQCREQKLDVCMMSFGEPDFDTPEIVKNAAIEAIRQNHTKYSPPEGLRKLREAISDKLRLENNIQVGAEQIVVSCGAKFAIAAAIAALCGVGDEVIIPVPAWVSYSEIVKASGAECVFLPTVAADNYELNCRELEIAITERTRLLILCSPSNPTGAVYSRETLEKIAEIAVRKNIMILSDECYEKFAFDIKRPHVSIASFNHEIAERTITINAFSKTYAMTGWRMGYSATPLWLTKRIIPLQCHFTNNIPDFIQYAGIAALQSCREEYEQMCRRFARRRDMICELLKEVPGIKYNIPQGAFYILIDISAFGISSQEFCERLIDEALISASPGSGFKAEGFIRLSYACSEETIEKACTRLRDFCRKLLG